MKTVFIVEGMLSDQYDHSRWIQAVFDTEEKANICKKKLESEEDADYYMYMIKEWEVL